MNATNKSNAINTDHILANEITRFGYKTKTYFQMERIPINLHVFLQSEGYLTSPRHPVINA